MLFDRSEHKNYDLDKVRVCGKHRYLLIFHILNNENWQTSELAIVVVHQSFCNNSVEMLKKIQDTGDFKLFFEV